MVSWCCYRHTVSIHHAAPYVAPFLEKQHQSNGVQRVAQLLTLARGLTVEYSTWRVSSTSLRYRRRLKRPTPRAWAIHLSANLRARMCSSCRHHTTRCRFTGLQNRALCCDAMLRVQSYAEQNSSCREQNPKADRKTCSATMTAASHGTTEGMGD